VRETRKWSHTRGREELGASSAVSSSSPVDRTASASRRLTSLGVVGGGRRRGRKLRGKRASDRWAGPSYAGEWSGPRAVNERWRSRAAPAGGSFERGRAESHLDPWAFFLRMHKQANPLCILLLSRHNVSAAKHIYSMYFGRQKSFKL
jgi:hypothetical protein